MGLFKRGGRLHGCLSRYGSGCDRVRYRGEAAVKGLLYVSPHSWFPRMKEGNGLVHGELFEGVSDLLLHQLDMIEGHPSLFERREVKTEEGERAWAYFYKPPVEGMTLLPSGKFDVKDPEKDSGEEPKNAGNL